MKLPNHVLNGTKVFLISSLIVLITATFGVTKPTYAGATLSNMSDVLSTNTQAATSVQHVITFTITAAVGTTIAISTSSAWGTTPSSTAGNYTVTVNGSGVSVTSVSGTSTSGFTLNHTGGFGGVSGNVVVVTASAAAAIQNQASAGSYSETITTGGGETGVLAVAIVTTTNNTVTVTGVVGPSITFTITGGNTFTLPSGGGNMSLANATANESAQGVNVNISTNAGHGANISVLDQYSGLYSSTAAYTIAAVGAGAASTLSAENYGMGVPTVGTGTVASQYLSTYAAAKAGKSVRNSTDGMVNAISIYNDSDPESIL